MTEIWKDIPGFEGYYQASSSGNIRSLSRRIVQSNGNEYQFTGRILKPFVVKRFGNPSYKQYTLWKDGVRRVAFGRKLVAETFLGPRPEGMEVCHNMPNSSLDDSVKNLRYDTHYNNMQDIKRHKTHNNSIKTHCPRGHNFTDKNTKIVNHGRGRTCTACLHSKEHVRWCKQNCNFEQLADLCYQYAVSPAELKNLGLIHVR